MGASTVLVLTREQDVTADLVICELGRRGIPVFRCDSGDFPGNLSLSTSLEAGRWRGRLRTTTRAVELANIGAVYHRRPTRFRFPAGMDGADREWAHDEALIGFGGVLADVDAVWVNHPHDLARAAFKPVQLTAARAMGMDVPATLVTSDPDVAREFVTSLPGGAVYKPMSGPPATQPPRALFTSRVTSDQIDAGVAGTAHMFQEWVDKAYEVRLMVVADEQDAQVFAARIDASTSAARVDWRADPDALTYSRIEVPDRVRGESVALVRRLGLRYGALDFAVDHDGRWWHFEINPSGQWAWIDPIRQPLTHAIADLLEKGTR